ncbi:MAG: ROK family protein, partial [Pseudomonadota bacterium]
MASDRRPPATPERTASSPRHGACQTERASIDAYSLEVEDAQGLVGDQASQTAFRQVLNDWQVALERVGSTPFGEDTADALSNDELDRMAHEGGGEAAQAIALAIHEFSARLAYAVGRFMRHDQWTDVERIVVGGGFKESAIGRLAIRRTQQRLAEDGLQVELRRLHHEADDGGLVGWAQLHPQGPPKQAFLAVDIGGTNVRCGIVAPVAADPGPGTG